MWKTAVKDKAKEHVEGLLKGRFFITNIHKLSFWFIQVETVGNSAGNISGVPIYVNYCPSRPNPEWHFIVGTLLVHKCRTTCEDDSKMVHFCLIGEHLLHAPCLWHFGWGWQKSEGKKCQEQFSFHAFVWLCKVTLASKFFFSVWKLSV